METMDGCKKKKKWWRPNKQYLFANKHIFVGMEICAFALAAVLANAVCLTTQLREKETQLSTWHRGPFPHRVTLSGQTQHV